MAMASSYSTPFFFINISPIPIKCFYVLFSLLANIVLGSSGVESESVESRRHALYQEILRDEAVARLNELGKMSPASVRAGEIIRHWMEDVGLTTWVDSMGNVHGRVEGLNASAEALLIGSHLDTVVDAGKFDGSLGIISAISALKVLKSNGMLTRLKRPVEVMRMDIWNYVMPYLLNVGHFQQGIPRYLVEPNN